MKRKAPYSKMKIADRLKLAKIIILEGTKMNDTQNKKIAQVTDKTLVVGVDVGSDKHFARATWLEDSKSARNPLNLRTRETDLRSLLTGHTI